MRYSFTRHFENQGGDPSQVGTDLTQLGFPRFTGRAGKLKLLPFMLFTDYNSPSGEIDGIGGTANYNTFIYASENSDASASITKVWGKHEITTGFEFMKRYLNVGQPPAPSGSYSFDFSATDQSTSNGGGGSDFASFLVGMGTAPGTETNNYPNFTKDIFAAESSPYYASFIEDTYHPTKTLTITAGLRWDIFGGRNERSNRLEYFSPNASNTASGVPYTGAEVYVNGGNRSPFQTNFKNIAPRLGFAWQPVNHLVVRGGGGFYYGPSTEMVGSALFDSDGFSSATGWNSTCLNGDTNTVFFNATCANPVPGNYTAPYSISNPFPTGVVPTLTTSPTGLANNLGTTLNTVLHSQRTPVTYNYNFGLEYELPHQVIVSVAYVGSRGLFLPLGTVDLNDLSIGTIQKYNNSLCVDSSQPSCINVPNIWAPIQPATNANAGLPTVPLWVALQQYPQFGSGNYGDGNGVLVHGYPGGDSEYNSFQAKVQKRLTSHFTTLASFTWAKLITDDGNPPLGFVGSHLGAPQDWKDLSYEHSVSPQDVKFQLTAQASYDLPVGKGRAMNLSGVPNTIFGGWTMNGILYLSTGVPIASPVVGQIPGQSVTYFNQRPDITCDPSSGAPHTATTWFNPNCFTFPASPFVAGTAPAYLDHVRTMGARDLDLSLYKTFNVGEAYKLRFEISSYNLTNHAQLGTPNVPDIYDVITQPSVAATFGQITSTVNTPRQFQFAARFTF